ncbi:N-myristoyl transferase [Hysterangium stoloniferum]|nr:N-myristoyl transferase [Hysterangium stoloniferum]
MTTQKARIEEVIDATEVDNAGSASESSGDERHPEASPSAQPSSSTASTSAPKKKKKKKSKAARALAALRPQDTIPQAIVDEVLHKVKTEDGPGARDINEAEVRKALELLKIGDVIKGKAGIGGKNRKEMGEHKFWQTQPVPQLGEGPPLDDGYIEPSKPREEVRQEAYPLPKDFQWCAVDLNDANQLKEVYELLSANYVEDDNAAFRFRYTAEFLEWALKPPGYHPEWHIGVRVSSNKKLVAFISGVPITLRARKNIVRASEINYLCVHKKLRSKRLAPVLIKEVTRQCHLKGVFQALYTAGVVLPTPVSTCRYYHRSLNIPKLVDVKFTYVPRNMTLARMIRSNKLPTVPNLAKTEGGLREMEDKDVKQVAELFSRYMQRFRMIPIMTLEELRHQFLSGKGKGERVPGVWKGRREGQVTWTYVVENLQTKRITDFFSFYTLPSSIIGNLKHGVLEAAYLFYYATDVAFSPGAEGDGRLQARLQELVHDALIVADQAKFDVFNALTLMDNASFLQDLKFGSGDGLLNYYLYNWRTAPLAGVEAASGDPIGRGVGVVML